MHAASVLIAATNQSFPVKTILAITYVVYIAIIKVAALFTLNKYLLLKKKKKKVSLSMQHK
jgi:hypothetical protein